MEESQSLGALLREVLARDRSLLGRREELLAVLEAHVTGAQVWAYRSLARAVRETTVAELLLAADAQDAAGRGQATLDAAETLRALGMQERALHRVIDALVEGLGWDEDAADAAAVPQEAPADSATGTGPRDEGTAVQPPEAAPPEIVDAEIVDAEFVDVPADGGPAAPAVILPEDAPAPGARPPVTDAVPAPPSVPAAVPLPAVWTCICGHAGNKGRFCTACGKSRDDGDSRTHASLVWACCCGRRGNKGKFCTACGRPRAEGEVALWTCTCGHSNAGRFCTACGRSRAEGDCR